MSHRHPEPDPDPEPRSTPGLDSGGGVRPGDTPPAEDSTAGAGPEERHNPTRGWTIIPLTAVLVVAALVIGFFAAYGIMLLLD